jgi:AcrR family transcriptional regulator
MAPGHRSSRPGPQRLPADVIAFEQRERLMAALATVVFEKGYEQTTITDIVTRAEIARPTFYKHFADRQECFLATFDALVGHLDSRMRETMAAETAWADQVAAAAIECLRVFSANPEAASVCLVEPAAVGEAIRPSLDEATERLISVLNLDRSQMTKPGKAPAVGIEEPLVDGVLALLGANVVAGRTAHLEELAAEVIASVLGPYIGFGEAKKIAESHTRKQV